jgi:sugar/nucleoside kinase (ribokinase family)
MYYYLMASKILLVGDIVLDILPAPFPIDKNSILADGETFIPNVTFQRGGNGGNFAAVLKSVYPDSEVIFYSRIGDDQHGAFLVQEMKQRHIITHFQRDAIPTQITIAISYSDGERHFITSVGALQNITYSEIPLILFTDVQHFALRGVWFMENLLPDCKKLLSYAYEKGLTTSLDVGFDPYWHLASNSEVLQKKASTRKRAFLTALPYVTYLFGNTGEFVALTNSNSLEDAIKILQKAGATTIIVHQGKKGVSIFSRTEATQNPEKLFEKYHIPGARVERILNPVGTGDTFDSIFLIQLLQNRNITKAAVFAAGGAALSLQSPPGTKISFADIEKFCLQDPILQNFQ